MQNYNKPFLRWAGGKRDFVPLLAPKIQRYLDHTGGLFIEPFAGSACMSIALGRPYTILGEGIEDLMYTYQAVIHRLKGLIHILKGLRDRSRNYSGEEFYYIIRDLTGETIEEIGARFIYLNCHSFNGMWRTNKSGEMNVPYGKKSDRVTDDLLDRIQKASTSLQKSSICFGYQAAMAVAKQGDVVYIDPPYSGTFSDYSKDGFTDEDQVALAGYTKQIADRGAVVIAHNSDTPQIQSLYSWLYRTATNERRAISSDGNRERAQCLLFSNVPAMIDGSV